MTGETSQFDDFSASGEQRKLSYTELELDRDLWRERALTAAESAKNLSLQLEEMRRENDRDKFELLQSHDAIRTLVGKVAQANITNDEIEARNFELARQAERDPLTGLLNRRTAPQHYERYRPRGTRRPGDMLSLLLLDLDNFKGINDSLGHSEGDNALKETAGVLTSKTREDDLVFRWGGEEFLVFLPAADEKNAKVVADHLRQTIKKEVVTTVSIGVVQVKPNELFEQALKRVDMALYAAKRQGRNRVVAFSLLTSM